MSHQVVSVRTYCLIFVTLLGLTVTTTLVAFRDLGPLNNLVALGIAVVKATLVVLYFMHARGSPRLTHLVIFSALAWLVLLFALTLGDYLSRDWLGVPGR